MKDITWNDNYAIGVEEIDRQHIDFVRLVRRFNIGIQKGIPMAVQLRILQELLCCSERRARRALSALGFSLVSRAN